MEVITNMSSHQIITTSPISCDMCGIRTWVFYTTNYKDYDGYSSLICMKCNDEYLEVKEFQNRE